MLENSWREKLKAGPMTGLYARLRRIKRLLLREPLAGVVPLPVEPWSVEAHLALLKQHPDHGRLYFSLAVAYFDRDEPGDMPKARACLRSAAALDFESPERIALYEALMAGRTGCSCPARALSERVPGYEWTEEEAAFLQGVLEGPDRGCGTGESTLEGSTGIEQEVFSARSVLVVGDELAATARWAPSAAYFLASPQVTGVDVTDLLPLGRRFEVGVRPANGGGSSFPQLPLCDRWLAVDFAALEKI
jgi:hypothetical protein